VHLSSAMRQDDMVHYYGEQLLKILWGNIPWREEREEKLKDEKVIVGLTEDLNMPSGYRHHRTGKCLWGNTPMPAYSEKYEPYLAKFDIKIK
jgi:hypothetical protein